LAAGQSSILSRVAATLSPVCHFIGGDLMLPQRHQYFRSPEN
jgi:hypothetical protein